jgi:hypothetical protein
LNDPLSAVAKAADSARKGITLPGVAVGAGGGAILTALSFQAFLDRMAADLGIGGIVMFILLTGAVCFIVFLFRFIFIQWRESSLTGQAQAAATTQSAIAETATALELKGLRDVVTELRAEVAGMARKIDSLPTVERRHGSH